MSDLDLKEGQLYLLDGNVLVEASFNDTTGLWQLHEPEERSNWMVSHNQTPPSILTIAAPALTSWFACFNATWGDG